ncbi:MAG: TatD family hydrolase [Treponema sp.]|jgi:TatD DNase family protein|nr:TatD family hydrolase [Treponema sp.]
MASDAHAHPGNLLERFPGAEQERRSLGVACAASAWSGEEFALHRELAGRARSEGAAPMALCFAAHPQLPALSFAQSGGAAADRGFFRPLLELLETLAVSSSLNAVGETGFDLYDQRFRSTEAVQDELFAAHLEIALRCALPLVIHARKALHKVFAHTAALKRLPAVVLHSYMGTAEEGASLLRRGVNAYFSFGAAILLNHKTAIRACALLPLDHLLLETDAPYQPLRGREFSRWADLAAIRRGAAAIRRAAGGGGGDPAEPEAALEAALEAATDRNFADVFFPE